MAGLSSTRLSGARRPPLGLHILRDMGGCWLPTSNHWVSVRPVARIQLSAQMEAPAHAAALHSPLDHVPGPVPVRANRAPDKS